MNNYFGESSFLYFFSRFANLIFPSGVLLDSDEFRNLAVENLDLNFQTFQKNFDILNLKFNVSKYNTFV